MPMKKLSAAFIFMRALWLNIENAGFMPSQEDDFFRFGRVQLSLSSHSFSECYQDCRYVLLYHHVRLNAWGA